MSAVSASPCSAKVEAAASGPSETNCALASGFSFFLIDAAPSADQIKAICQSAACSQIVAALKAASPSECTLSDGGGFYLYKDILAPITTQCKTTASNNVTGTVAPPVIEETTTNANTVAPAIATTPYPFTRPPAPSPTPAEDHGARTGMIFGIVAACVMVPALIYVFVQVRKDREWFYRRFGR